MTKLNRLTGAIAIALSLGTSSSMAADYYIPYEIVELQGDKIHSLDSLEISDNGFVSVSTNMKPLYWSTPDNPTVLNIGDPSNLTGTVATLTMNDAGKIAAAMQTHSNNTVIYKLATWAPSSLAYSSYLLDGNYESSQGPRAFKLNNNDQFVYAEFNNQNYRTEPRIFDIATSTKSEPPILSAFGTNGAARFFFGYNSQGSILFHGNTATQSNAFGSYSTTEGAKLLSGSDSDAIGNFSWKNYTYALNDNGLAAGYVYRLYSSGNPQATDVTKCLAYSIENTQQRYEFNANHILDNPNTHGLCVIKDINNNDLAVGNVTYSTNTSNDVENKPFVWDPSTSTATSLFDLIQYDSSVTEHDLTYQNNLHLSKVNNNGDIIGYTMATNIHPYNQRAYAKFYYFKAMNNPAPLNEIVDNDAEGSMPGNSWALINYNPDFLVPISAKWETDSSITNHQGADYNISVQNGKKSKFTWTYEVPHDASLTVKVLVPVNGGNDENAEYELLNGSTVIYSNTFDQSNFGNAEINLGSYTFSEGDKITVRLTGSGQKNLIADAIQIIQ